MPSRDHVTGFSPPARSRSAPAVSISDPPFALHRISTAVSSCPVLQARPRNRRTPVAFRRNPSPGRIPPVPRCAMALRRGGCRAVSWDGYRVLAEIGHSQNQNRPLEPGRGICVLTPCRAAPGIVPCTDRTGPGVPLAGAVSFGQLGETKGATRLVRPPIIPFAAADSWAINLRLPGPYLNVEKLPSVFPKMLNVGASRNGGAICSSRGCKPGGVREAISCRSRQIGKLSQYFNSYFGRTCRRICDNLRPCGLRLGTYSCGT